MPPEPFFSGEGLDRADHLRANPEAIWALHGKPDARMLMWENGAPAVDELGKLCWQVVEGAPPLFLGFGHGAPRFSSLPDGDAPIDARAHFQLLSVLK